MFIMKTDEYGKEIWIRTYADNAALSVEETNDHGFIISGLSFGEEELPFLKKVDTNGNGEWMELYTEIPQWIFWHIKQGL